MHDNLFSIIELAKQLIACPSLSPDDAGCQPILIERLSRAGFKCESMRFGSVDNLWARRGNQAPLIVFAGHTDVVPPGLPSDWLSSPFQPAIRDEYLYGRGAADMKGALAAMVVAAESLIKKRPHFSGSMAFLLTSDEESHAINGTKKVIETLQKRGEKMDYCIIGEPSSEQRVGDQIRVGRRGSLHGKLLIKGKQGHVAHPHLALNPIHTSLLALHELSQIVWDEGNADFPPTTFQITNMHSGTGAANVIPGHLEVLFNFRFATAVTIKQLQERTEAIFQHHAINYKINWEVGAHPFLTKKGNLLKIAQQILKKMTGLDAKLSTGGGTSDGRFIAPTGTEIIELGVSHQTAHHVNECVHINELNKLAISYQQIAEELLYEKMTVLS